MLIKDVMNCKVVTVSTSTPVGEAQRIMKENNFSRLPVVDHGRLVGVVSIRRLEEVKPRTTAPLLWQITYLISRTTVGDVMRKRVVTVKPTDTVERAIAKAQSAKVGTLIVLDRGTVVGICTTTDFFYKIVNPTLGLGIPGIRILVSGDSIGAEAEKVIACVNKAGIEVKVLWAIPSSGNRKDIILHLESEDADKVLKELEKLGCKASILER
ncbi:MAG: CBS domain-containing protein [Chloroflexota bacterium]